MPIITISRGTLSGGKLLAQTLSSRLGLKTISREVVMTAAQEYGVSEDELFKSLESRPRLWEKLSHRRQRYVLAIQAALAEMVEDDKVVYHGLAGQILLKDLSNVIKVRLIAPMEYRIRAAMDEQDITHEHALKFIEEADHMRAQWVHRMYGVEWTDPALYDLVLNLGHVSLDTAADFVTRLAGRKEFASTDETRQELKDFALATHIRAALAFKSNFSEHAVQVSVRGGIVNLAGGTDFETNRTEIIAFVKTVPGATQMAPHLDDVETADVAEQTAKTAGDVMVPLSGYPHLHEGVTIREAIMAVGASSVVLADGHLVSPRYVLVLDEADGLVGVIGRRNLLRGLTPQLNSFQEALQKVGHLTPVPSMPLPVTLRWDELFSKSALRASWQPVKSIMAPIRATVNIDDSLTTVVSTMVHHDVDLAPVVQNNKAVGVVLMTDVFDTVAQFILERGVKKPDGVS